MPALAAGGGGTFIGTAPDCAAGVPHAAQKAAPSSFCAPHFEQNAITLNLLAESDISGVLFALQLSLSAGRRKEKPR
jgi:hypothetical protein